MERISSGCPTRNSYATLEVQRKDETKLEPMYVSMHGNQMRAQVRNIKRELYPSVIGKVHVPWAIPDAAHGGMQEPGRSGKGIADNPRGAGRSSWERTGNERRLKSGL